MIINKDIRKQLKKLFLMYKIKKNGEIHVLGIMPNTKIFGWYLLGFTGTDYIDNLFLKYIIFFLLSLIICIAILLNNPTKKF